MPGSFQVRSFPDAPQLARGAATEFSQLAAAAVHDKDLFTVVLSGGSTPKSLYSLLAHEPWCSEFPWNKTHFFWGDERHVAPTHPDSNFRMADEALLSKVPVPSENIHRIKAEEPDPAVAAREYEDELKTFFKLSVAELPRFDLVLLGLGTDGHVASLFPDTDALRERDRLCVANWVKKLNAWRITLTLPVLNNAANVLFLVSGVEKAEIVRAVLQGAGTQTYPAQLVRPANGTVLWLLDRPAASLLGE